MAWCILNTMLRNSQLFASWVLSQVTVKHTPANPMAGMKYEGRTQAGIVEGEVEDGIVGAGAEAGAGAGAKPVLQVGRASEAFRSAL